MAGASGHFSVARRRACGLKVQTFKGSDLKIISVSL